MKYTNILEEEIKNKVTQDFFQKFDCTKILGKIDFAVKAPHSPLKGGKKEELEGAYLLWAEAKRERDDIISMLTQLVLTIGKARTFDEILPPPFLGCYDNEKIAFVPYSEIQDIFYQNDFNWKVTPSNTETREFKQVYAQIKKLISPSPTLPKEEGVAQAPWQTYIFDFVKDEKELKRFIRDNFVVGKTETTKIRIDKNNFITIYSKWLETVKSTIGVNWDAAKKVNIIDGDFYLADLLSQNNETIKEKLFVLLKSNVYKYNRQTDDLGEIFREAYFSDNQKAHTQFWAKYERPPIEEYWDYIINRRDLLVPQDVRERKGSFFTPQIWVELSQKYLADTFGEDWQDEYYVWDCAAGTGNLLAGLTNKYNIWASTLDKADVDVMNDRIQNGANLLESHVFQFDFLNDDFTKLPQGLQDIINDPKRRKKLIIYINPPYAEGDARLGKGRKGIQESKIHDKYQKDLGKASGELFAQFFMRIYQEIPDAILAEFSKLKILQAPNFEKFRNVFKAKLEKLFLVPASTFDNVSGQFPIGFFVWRTSKKEKISCSIADVYDEKGRLLDKKNIFFYDNSKYISDWLEEKSKNISKNHIGHLASVGNDFQNKNTIFIDDVNKRRKKGGRHTMITVENLMVVSIYFAVRKCIEATWLNDRDQFLYPNDGWEIDMEFQNDCLAYTLFNNNISTKYGVNHWIPFTEKEVNARDKFDSHFMLSFINGKIIQNGYSNLFEQEEDKMCIKRTFSPEANNVFNAGKELWKYYHAAIFSSKGGGREEVVNASLYDIREYFQGRNDKGNMNNKSEDETYNKLINNLRSTLKILAKKIEPKVYEYGFLKG